MLHSYVGTLAGTSGAVVLDCNQFSVTLQIGGAQKSLPLSFFDISLEHEKLTLVLTQRPPGRLRPDVPASTLLIASLLSKPGFARESR
jgi:hypothetical protein